jgi:hypothetical protein
MKVSSESTMRYILFISALAVLGCADQPSGAPGNASLSDGAKLDGMTRYPYLSADGGPHLLLPHSHASSWSGVSSALDVLDPKSDFGRACAATEKVQLASISVGQGKAIVLADPPMTSWGRSDDGLIEVYYLETWTDMDLDALISRATSSITTASMTDSGESMELPEPNFFLLYAGDTPNSVAYNLHQVPLPAGDYRILVGSYSGNNEAVTVYRFQPLER